MFNSDIVINNLGPISKANINLKNLTVFVGQNNTGKTYLLSCLFFFQTNDFKKILSEIIKDNTNRYSFNNNNDFSIKDSQKILENIFNDISKIDVLDSMNFNASNYINKSTFQFSVPEIVKNDIYLVSDVISKDNILVNTILKLIMNKIKDKDVFDMLNLPSSKMMQDESYFNKFTKFMVSVFGINDAHEMFLRSICFKFFNLQHDKERSSYMFPVERAGINKFFYEAIYKLNETNLALKSFIEFKLKLNNDTLNNQFNKTSFYDIARTLETELFKGGKIWNEKISENTFQIIFFNKDNQKFTLDNFSSSINELSVFILYLKYYAKEGDVIFIDEPEISLHPDSQRILVRFLSELSKIGLKFVIITHSDYIVKELNNLICIKDISSENKISLKHYYSEKNELDYNLTRVYSIYEEENDVVIRQAEEGEYGFEEKLFTNAINSISGDSNKIFSLIQSNFGEKININIEELYE